MATCKDCLFKCYTDDADRVEETCNFFLSKDRYAEIVRCKDCQHYFSPNEYDIFGLCTNARMHISDGGDLYMAESDFCSYGERKQ